MQLNDWKKKISLAALVAFSALSLSQVDPGRTVAVINGEEIKGSEYYRRMEYLPGVGKRYGQSFGEFPPGFLTIETMITERLVIQMAKEKGVLPTDAEVQADLRLRSEEDPKIVENWLNSGRTQAELNDLIRFEVAQFKLLTFGINIADQEVQQFYKDNQAMFTIPRRFKLRIIVVSNETNKQAVDTDLKAGVKFEDVAKKLSEDVTRLNGGDFGTMPISVIPEAARKALEGVKIGQTTAWTETGVENTIAKFFLENVIKEEVQPLTPKLLRDTRRQLMLQRGSVKNNLEKDMVAMRKKAKIDIKQKEFADAYAKFIDAFLREQAGKGN